MYRAYRAYVYVSLAAPVVPGAQRTGVLMLLCDRIIGPIYMYIITMTVSNVAAFQQGPCEDTPLLNHGNHHWKKSKVNGDLFEMNQVRNEFMCCGIRTSFIT